MSTTPESINSRAATYWAPRAWVDGRWRDNVLLRVDSQGRWVAIAPDTPAPPAGSQRINGAVLPGMVNAHSHAFQRAFVGMAERREQAHDDFWSWRDRMYGVALRITPEQLHAVASHLYRELLQGGYTQVCEFHYLHHDLDGKPYDDPLAMCRALVQAAADTGIGLTLLPVLYERAGFNQPTLRADQRRFATDVARVLALRDGVQSWQAARVNTGVAIHSLRAATPQSIVDLTQSLNRVPGQDTPIHIHVAEQVAEVDDCLAVTGQRPIEWLLNHLPLDAHWQLVHATHATPAEIEGVRQRGAGVVLCPTTEANLGDGLVDLPRWLAAKVPLALGSDSQVTRQWPEELRMLEYGQRLALRRRNVAADPSWGQGSTAARLFEQTLQAGGRAAGFAQWGLRPGARADLLVINQDDLALAWTDPSHTLDALVFAGPSHPFSSTLVAGRWVSQPGE